MRFSEIEIKDLLVAWVLVSIAFAIALRQTASFLTNVWLAAFTVGVGFLAHELAHKFVAQRYGKFAEFRANVPMLIFAVILSFSGVVIAAPGAVVISGFVSRRQNGVISAAGPIANIALALILLPLYLLVAGEPSLLALLFGFGLLINAWLALFNMIPFWVFDGAKVFGWNKLAYASIVVASFALVLASSFIYQF